MILALVVLEKFHPKPSQAAFSTVFPYDFLPEVENDVISGMAVDNVGMYVPIKFGDSRSNGFRDIRGAYFVSNEQTLAKAIPTARNAAFRLKKPKRSRTNGKACATPQLAGSLICAKIGVRQKCGEHSNWWTLL